MSDRSLAGLLDRRISIFLSKVRLSDESAFGDPIPNHIVLIGREHREALGSVSGMDPRKYRIVH
jgi:hypothetical protein